MNTAKHETRVQNFYGTGIDGYHEYHNGYLNFGYWTVPGMRYEEAAENLIRLAGNTLKLRSTSCLLDVGCDMGAQDVFLAKAFRPYSIDAVDLTEKHVVRAKERARRYGVDSIKLRFCQASGTDLPFPDEYFTHALSVEAPEHFDTREDFFDEAYRVLAPGGILTCTDYSLGREPKNILERALVEITRRLWHVPRANVYGNAMFKEKLHSAGFTDVFIQDISASVIPGYYFEHRRWESMREMMKIRGLWKGVIAGFLIDWAVYTAYQTGLCEYILLRAEKPKEEKIFRPPSPTGGGGYYTYNCLARFMIV